MKQKVTIKQVIYATIKAMPTDVQGHISRCALDYLFAPDSEVMVNDAAVPFWTALKVLIDHDLHVSEMRKTAANSRWQPILHMQTYAKQCKAMQKRDIEQKEGIKENKNEQNEQENGVLHMQSDANTKIRKREDEKETKKEKESIPHTPFKEKEINKEKEEEKKSVYSYARTRENLESSISVESSNSPKSPSQRMTRPTVEEVQTYILKMGYTFSAEEFHAFYESNGWKVGRNPMKSWQAACRTWQGSKPKTTPVKSGVALPLGLPADEWANVDKWIKANTRLNLSPDDYLTIRALCHRKAGVIRAILEAVAVTPNVTDIVAEAKRLSNRDPYRQTIWAD